MQMTQVPPQSDAEIRHICDEWVRNFAPTIAPRLILNAKNFEKISQRCFQKGYVSITYLTESYGELAAAGALELTPEPKILTAAEKALLDAEKAEARMRQDYLDSIKQQPSFEERVKLVEKAEQESKAEEKRQQAAQSQINTSIDSYSINLGPGRLDISRAEYFKDQLRQIKVKKNGKYDAVLTFKKVREALSKMP